MGNLLPLVSFGATLTPPHRVILAFPPSLLPRPGWGPIVCARFAQLWGLSAHFPSDAGPTCQAGEHRNPEALPSALRTVGTVPAAPPLLRSLGAGLPALPSEAGWDGSGIGAGPGFPCSRCATPASRTGLGGGLCTPGGHPPSYRSWRLPECYGNRTTLALCPFSWRKKSPQNNFSEVFTAAFLELCLPPGPGLPLRLKGSFPEQVPLPIRPG